MKICIIVDDYLPHSIKVSAKMMHEMAKEYVNSGHEVCVITPTDYIKNSYYIKTLDGVKVYYFKSGKIKNVNFIKRAINETLLSFRAWKSLKNMLKDTKFDLVIYYSPSIFWGKLVQKIKQISDAKSYLILRDIFPKWAVEQGLINKNSLVERYFKFFENLSYKNADKIGLMSPKNLEVFYNDHKFNNLEILYNWADNISAKSTGKFRKELNLEDKTVFFYGGNMGYAQDMMNIIRLAKNLYSYKEVHFVLVGVGNEVDKIKSAIEEDNIKNITILPAVDQTTYLEMLSEFDVGLFTLHKDHTTHNFPGKLLGYMAQSKPILGSINSGNDLRDIIEKYNAGLISINGEDELFLSNAIKLLDKSYRDKISQNSNKLLNEVFSTKAACQKILNFARKNI